MDKKPLQTSKGTPVYCSCDELVNIEKLVPNPRNPNTHPEKQIELLAKIIANQGWRAPITVSKRSGFVVRGHGRLMAAKKLGETDVPVDFQDYQTEAEEWADLIADNRLNELSAVSNDILKDLLEEIDTGEIDLELTGFLESEIEKLMTNVMPLDDDEQNDEPNEKRFMIVSFRMDREEYEKKVELINKVAEMLGIVPQIQEDE